MLSVKINNEWLPLSDIVNAHIEYDQEGTQVLSFDVPPSSDLFTYLKTETEIRAEENLYLIKSINKLIRLATVTCELNLDEWKSSFYLKSVDVPSLITKTLGDVLDHIKPPGWTILNTDVRSIKRTPDCEKCNAYDILIRCKQIFDVQYDFDCLNKILTVVDPNAIVDTGVYITPELNMVDNTYKESSGEMITRLYCYGADDLTFEGINDGKPYIDLNDYKGPIIVGSWTDGRYYNMESLLEDGRKKLNELAVPVGSYAITMIDLAAIDERYKNLKVNLRDTIHCILDPTRGIDVPHKVVKIRRYLLVEDRDKDIITLSNEPRTIGDMVSQMSENVDELTQDGYRKETTIRNNSESIELIAEKTEKNTSDIEGTTQGIKKIEQKITPEQMLITVSDSINKGNKLNTIQVIIDLLGLTIKNGSIKVYDGNNNLVFYVDQGTKKLIFTGSIQGSSITNGNNFNVDTAGNLRCSNADIRGVLKSNATGKEYFHLCVVGAVAVGTGLVTTVQLPSDFKGKDFNVIAMIIELPSQPNDSDGVMWICSSFKCYVDSVDRSAGIFKVHCRANYNKAQGFGYMSSYAIGFNYIAVA